MEHPFCKSLLVYGVQCSLGCGVLLWRGCARGRRLPSNSKRLRYAASISYAASDDALDLLRQLLTLHPGARIGAAAALEHDYFRAAPSPASPSALAPQVRPSSGMRRD